MSLQESSREALSDGYAQFFARAVGMPASTGRIFAALLLNSAPLSQAQLRSNLSLSDGSVSEGLGLLVAEGLVERSGNPRSRPAFFQVRAGSWADAALVMLENLKASHALAQATMQHLEEQDIAGPSVAWAASAHAMYDKLLADLPVAVHQAIDAAARPRVRRGRRSAAS